MLEKKRSQGEDFWPEQPRRLELLFSEKGKSEGTAVLEGKNKFGSVKQAFF